MDYLETRQGFPAPPGGSQGVPKTDDICSLSSVFWVYQCHQLHRPMSALLSTVIHVFTDVYMFWAMRTDGKNHAAAYLQYRVTPRELISTIMGYMEKKASNQFELAVDVGCGSGQATILLAPYFTKVVGTDISPAQLEMAQTNKKPPNVSYRQSPAEDLPFASGEVDLVTAFTAAHWFDRQKFLLEADRVLRPGGCLALLSYTMEMELEYGDISNALNDICKEFYAALLPFRDPHLGLSSSNIYSDMFDSCCYPDKEWNECFLVKRILPVSGYIGMVESFSSYQKLLQKDPSEAERLSTDTRNKLLSAMKTSSPDPEVTVVVKYFYWLACKP